MDLIFHTDLSYKSVCFSVFPASISASTIISHRVFVGTILGYWRREYNASAVFQTYGHDVTFISIAVTGVLANITKSFSQSALGHKLYDGIRTFFTKEAAGALHGEIVAVALFTQLYYNHLTKDKDALKAFMAGLGMPLTLKELGVDGTEENLKLLKDFLIDSPYVVPTEENLSQLHEAMKQMN